MLPDFIDDRHHRNRPARCAQQVTQAATSGRCTAVRPRDVIAIGQRYRVLETIRQYGQERLAEWATPRVNLGGTPSVIRVAIAMKSWR
jgi:hypothetical protein